MSSHRDPIWPMRKGHKMVEVWHQELPQVCVVLAAVAAWCIGLSDWAWCGENEMVMINVTCVCSILLLSRNILWRRDASASLLLICKVFLFFLILLIYIVFMIIWISPFQCWYDEENIQYLLSFWDEDLVRMAMSSASLSDIWILFKFIIQVTLVWMSSNCCTLISKLLQIWEWLPFILPDLGCSRCLK